MHRLSVAMVALIFGLSAGTACAETLGDVLKARGLAPSHALVPGLDRALGSYGLLEDGRELLVVYAIGERESARLHATRFGRASRTWKTVPLQLSKGALGVDYCRSGLDVKRFAGGDFVRSHINPSAECTIVLGPDLELRTVLAGWPVATLGGGRLVYQRNQVHFASVHPVALALFDPRGAADVTLYPRKPYQPLRSAHIARMRAVYTDAWCSARNHPCDPDVFDEHVVGDVVTDARGDALAFVMAWDNTTGWSDVERWGRLEAFREVRRALARWDGQSQPTVDLYRNLAAGLARVRNMKREADVSAALEGEPTLRDLVGAALAALPAPGRDARAWLVALDARWGNAEAWRRLARAVEVPDELTEVVYVFTGLRRPDKAEYRELSRQAFEARFGAIPLRRALEPGILRQIFGAGLE